ncbi:hypothetical protein BDY24DRAFT_397636 [Mrakia frigida]|uniref:mRNA splicing protein SMB1 n=1 Tax=Mrakia frigida TaxID=29902 RepID=UPI003FCBF71F
MMTLINYRLKVTLNDGRSLIGQMLAFDKHMNLVLAECEEFRKVKARKAKDDAGISAPVAAQEMKRTLGLVILRGETVVSISIEGPPPKEAEESTSLPLGPGKGVPAGRGMGLGGAGIPPPSMAARPMPYAQPPPGFPMQSFARPPPGFPGAPPAGFRPPMGFPGAPPPGFPPQGFRPPM